MDLNQTILPTVALIGAGISASLIAHGGVFLPVDAITQALMAVVVYYGLQYLYARQGLMMQPEPLLIILCVCYPIGAVCTRILGPVMGMLIGMPAGYLIGRFIVRWWQQGE
jgi:hypothetical protein